MKYKTNKLLIDHPGLNQVLKYIVMQANISIPYCVDRWGTNNSLTDIWQIGKTNLVYKNDADKIEQIQSVPTLFLDNIHKIQGAGDCDCFTVFTIAMLKANNFDSQKISIYLQGQSKSQPSHVLTDYDGIKLDFTQPIIDDVRKYKYYDIIKI